MAGASEPTPALEGLAYLAGTWEMELSQAGFLPEGERARGTATFEFVENRRFLALRQGDAATWMIGRDDASVEYTVLYSDTRGVSRVYAMTLEGEIWTICRDDPDFSQRFEAVIAADKNTIDGSWKRRHGHGPWQHDFAVTYRRLG